MRRVTGSHGFTVVETLIFLAVSGVMFASAILVVGGQQAKTEFRQAAGEARSIVDDTANDVATGYYQSPGTTDQCRNFFGEPGFWGGDIKERGENETCIIVGQAIQFGQGTSMTVYPVVGFRARGVERRLTENLTTDSTVGAVATIFNNDGFANIINLPYGLTVASAIAEDNGTRTAVRGAAFVSSLGGFTNGVLEPGTTKVDVIALRGSLVPPRDNLFKTQGQDDLRETNEPPIKNPSGGITVCLDSGGTNQHILLRFGANSNLASSIDYREGMSASDAECSV